MTSLKPDYLEISRIGLLAAWSSTMFAAVSLVCPLLLLPVICFGCAPAKKTKKSVKSKISERQGMPKPSKMPKSSSSSNVSIGGGEEQRPAPKAISAVKKVSKVETKEKEEEKKMEPKSSAKPESKPGDGDKKKEPSAQQTPSDSTTNTVHGGTLQANVDMGTYEHLGPPEDGKGSNEKADKKPEKSAGPQKSKLDEEYKAPPLNQRPKKPAALQEVEVDKQLASMQIVATADAPGFD